METFVDLFIVGEKPKRQAMRLLASRMRRTLFLIIVFGHQIVLIAYTIYDGFTGYPKDFVWRQMDVVPAVHVADLILVGIIGVLATFVLTQLAVSFALWVSPERGPRPE